MWKMCSPPALNWRNLSPSERRVARRIALTLLRRERRLIPFLPSACCLVFGVCLGSPACLIVARVLPPLGSPLLEIGVSLGVVAVCATLGGVIGLKVLNCCIEKRRGAAMDIMREVKGSVNEIV